MTVNGATGITPFEAMFGADAFELDNEIRLQTRINKDQVLGKNWQRNYRHCTKTSSEKDIRLEIELKNITKRQSTRHFMKKEKVYNPQADLEKGHALSAPWIGHHVIVNNSPMSRTS